MKALVLLLVGVVPHDEALIEDRFAVLEVNHFYNERGELVFDQLICWEWIGDTHHVEAWRLLKHPSQFPVRDPRGGYRSLYAESGGTLRLIRGDAFRETWTQYDPELRDRESHPKCDRRDLSKGGEGR